MTFLTVLAALSRPKNPTPNGGPSKRRRPRRALLTAGALLSVVAASFGAFAAFTTTRTVERPADTGAVIVEIDDGASTLNWWVYDTFPGRSVEQTVTLINTGTVELYGAGEDDPAGAVGLQLITTNPYPEEMHHFVPLFEDPSNGFQIEVFRCPTEWALTGWNPPQYDCPDAVQIVEKSPVKGVFNLPPDHIDSYEPGGTDHLMFRFTFPASVPQEYEYNSMFQADFTFLAVQRDGVVRSS